MDVRHGILVIAVLCLILNCFSPVASYTDDNISNLFKRIAVVESSLKQLTSKCSKNKITVNTGPVMFSGEIYYYWPLIQLTKSLVNIVFLCIIYMYNRRNIPMAKKRFVCFQSKKICRFFFISNNYYIYLIRYFEIFVTNLKMFLVYSVGQPL